MTRPLPVQTSKPLAVITQLYKYPLQPARDLTFAHEVGKAMVIHNANPVRMASLARIYSNMLPEAKAQCDFARSWLIVEGGVQS